MHVRATLVATATAAQTDADQTDALHRRTVALATSTGLVLDPIRPVVGGGPTPERGPRSNLQAGARRVASGGDDRVCSPPQPHGGTAMSTVERTHQAPTEIAKDTFVIHDHTGEVTPRSWCPSIRWSSAARRRQVPAVGGPGAGSRHLDDRRSPCADQLPSARAGGVREHPDVPRRRRAPHAGSGGARRDDRSHERRHRPVVPGRQGSTRSDAENVRSPPEGGGGAAMRVAVAVSQAHAGA